jgi:hypothetical protein
MPVVAKVVPARVDAVNPLTKGEKVDGVYVADTRTLEEAGIGGVTTYPSGEYLATKQSVLAAVVSVVPTDPPWL